MWIEIFRTGNHTSSNGTSENYTLESLNEIANNYNNKLLESDSFMAPLVKGHPNSDAPAYGWVSKLARKGDTLLAKIKDISNEVIDEVKSGKFKKISISLYKVQGLKPLEFNYEDIDSDFKIIENESQDFSELIDKLEKSNEEINSLKNEITQLKAIESKNKIMNFAESLSKAYNLEIKQNEELVDILSEAEKISKDFREKLQNSLKNILHKEKNTFDFSEYAKNKSNYNDKVNNFTNGNISEERLALHHRVADIMRENNKINYEDALKIALS